MQINVDDKLRFIKIGFMGLKSQCKSLNIPLTMLEEPVSEHPESQAMDFLRTKGYIGSIHEGRAIGLIIKCMCLDSMTLTSDYYGSETIDPRQDACLSNISSFSSKSDEKLSVILDEILTISKNQYIRNAQEILSYNAIHEWYSDINIEFLSEAFDCLPKSDYALIAKLISKDLLSRAGWPDITAIIDRKIKFFEVKTTDRLHESQIIAFSTLLREVQVEISVIQICGLAANQREKKPISGLSLQSKSHLITNEQTITHSIANETDIPDDIWLLKGAYDAEIYDFSKDARFSGSIYSKEKLANSILSSECAQTLKMVPSSYRQVLSIFLSDLSDAKIHRDERFDSALELYYKLKLLATFGFANAKIANTCGINVLIGVPGALFLALDTPFHEYGYAFLKKITKKEVKWFTEKWGEPKTHKDLNSDFLHIWEAYELAYKKKTDRDFVQYIQPWLDIVAASKSSDKQH